MDDVCVVGAGLAVPPWRSSQNENSRVAKEKEDKKCYVNVIKEM